MPLFYGCMLYEFRFGVLLSVLTVGFLGWQLIAFLIFLYSEDNICEILSNLALFASYDLLCGY